jgi:hypothetical protein
MTQINLRIQRPISGVGLAQRRAGLIGPERTEGAARGAVVELGVPVLAGLEVRVVDRVFGLQRIGNLQQQRKLFGGRLGDAVVVLARRRIGGPAIVVGGEKIDFGGQRPDRREIDMRNPLPIAVVPAFRLGVDIEFAGRLLGDQTQRAALGILAEQRALRAAQYFDALEIVQFERERILAPVVHVVDVDGDGVFIRDIGAVRVDESAHADFENGLIAGKGFNFDGRHVALHEARGGRTTAPRSTSARDLGTAHPSIAVCATPWCPCAGFP